MRTIITGKPRIRVVKPPASPKVFVIGTGRCGTTTFFHAASHAINYTAIHESLAGHPDAHTLPFATGPTIEIGGMFVYFAGLLRRRYPNARWVHLIRDRTACVDSLISQIPAFGDWYAQHLLLTPTSPRHAAELYYDAVNALCRTVAPQAHTLRLEEAYEKWPACWRHMGCRGDLAASREEWRKAYNATTARGRDQYVVPLVATARL